MHNVQYVMSALMIKTMLLTHTACIEPLYTRDDGRGGVNIWFIKKNMSLYHCIAFLTPVAVCWVFVCNKPEIKFKHSSKHTEHCWT